MCKFANLFNFEKFVHLTEKSKFSKKNQ